MNAKVTAATGRVKDNGIISDITPSPHCLAQTHTPLLHSPPGDESAVWARLPPTVHNPASLPRALPAPDPPTCPPCGRARRAWRGRVYSVTFLSLRFFFFPLLLRPPRPALSAASASQARKYYTTETTLAGDHLLPANTAAHINKHSYLSKTHARKKPRHASVRQTCRKMYNEPLTLKKKTKTTMNIKRHSLEMARLTHILSHIQSFVRHSEEMTENWTWT